MAPLKQLNKLPPTGLTTKDGIKTRSQVMPMKRADVFPKRKADESPLKRLTVKRTALNELTNLSELSKENAIHIAKENGVQMVKAKITTTAILKKPVLTTATNTNYLASQIPKGKPKSGLAVRKPLADQKNQLPVPAQKPAEKEKPPVPAKPAKKVHPEPPSTVSIKQAIQPPVAIKAIRKQQNTENHAQAVSMGVQTRRSLARKSLELEKSSDNSLYVSALEDLKLAESENDENEYAMEIDDLFNRFLTQKKFVLSESSKSQKGSKKADKLAKKIEKKPPPGVLDYDQEQLRDLFSASVYAMDIFDYLKRREKDFIINEYFARQDDLNPNMRALLVDWMVEVQENFEVNHESLYLGVKLVDLYLSKVVIRKENLQLVGITGLFIACKYDERLPPALEDFVYVCDGLYQADDLLQMERKMLRSVNFELGIPLSYRFLRRYARCGKYEMPLLTLARFILETSLMDHNTINCSDSKMAAAALYLALQMKGQSWTKTMEYYSGYKTQDFKDIALKFNEFLHKPNKNLKTVKTKYSHSLFYEVAKIPLVPHEKLDFTSLNMS